MTMKANELRIGNWVDWDNKTIRSQVKGIHPSGKYAHLENGWVDLIRCDSIPLTEEWLVKFGFYEYDRMGNNIFFSFKEIESFNFNLCLYFYELRVNFYGLPWDKSIKIYQVHQLQNLYFALTGEELQLK